MLWRYGEARVSYIVKQTIMYIWTSIFGMCLYFSSVKKISAYTCETYLYKEINTTFSIKGKSTEICGISSGDVTHTILDSNFGEVNFNITFNGSLCGGHYIFEISNENSLHSKQQFSICAQECDQNSTFILNTNPSLNFKTSYIFTGSYNILLKSKNGSKIWSSEAFNIITKHIQMKLHNAVDFKCFLSPRNTFRIFVDLNRTIFLRPPLLKIFVVPPDTLNYSNNSFCYENHPKKCNSSTDYEQFYDYMFDVKSGKYKTHIVIDDLRCSKGTLWGNDDPIPCVYENCCAITVPTQSSTKKIIIVSIILIITVITASTVFFLTKKFCKKLKAERSCNLYTIRYNREPRNEKYKYLIIHARESEQFEKLVYILRKLISDSDSKVTTLYELDPRCADPQKWLQNYLRDDCVKVILLLNLASAYACDKIHLYRVSHCFDFLFPYAIHLLQSYEQRSYHNLYKVLCPRANGEEFRFINTLTVYYLPQHITNLITDLQITIDDETQQCIEVLINECSQYRDCTVNSQQYLHDIFVNRIVL